MSGGPAAAPGHADVVEYLGNEELIHVNCGWPGHRRGRRQRAPGPARRRVELQIPLDKVHLFDPETGLTMNRSLVEAAGVAAAASA